MRRFCSCVTQFLLQHLLSPLRQFTRFASIICCCSIVSGCLRHCGRCLAWAQSVRLIDIFEIAKLDCEQVPGRNMVVYHLHWNWRFAWLKVNTSRAIDFFLLFRILMVDTWYNTSPAQWMFVPRDAWVWSRCRY